ncbi:hypothetical protein BSKO_04835 [Bryopsis sp. KO-2023]|nr:hypothetical protein BSKO_04835 [Bryopsis sp. KO-2023]
MLARLHGVSMPELQSLGFWTEGKKGARVCHEAYGRFQLADTVARLAGFLDGAEGYFIERAALDPLQSSDPLIHAMAHALFPELDDPGYERRVYEATNEDAPEPPQNDVLDRPRKLQKRPTEYPYKQLRGLAGYDDVRTIWKEWFEEGANLGGGCTGPPLQIAEKQRADGDFGFPTKGGVKKAVQDRAILVNFVKKCAEKISV